MIPQLTVEELNAVRFAIESACTDDAIPLRDLGTYTTYRAALQRAHEKLGRPSTLSAKESELVRQLNQQLDPASPAGKIADRFAEIQRALDLVHALTDGDLKTHREAWRRGLQKLIANAKPLTIEDSEADHSFWTHELAVFDRVFELLCSTTPRVTALDVDNSVQGGHSVLDSLYTHKRGGRYRVLAQHRITPIDPATHAADYIHDMGTVTLDIIDGRVVAYAGLVTNTANIGGYTDILPATGYRLQYTGEWTTTDNMVVYHEIDKNTLWLRPASEFWDGRFTRIEA